MARSRAKLAQGFDDSSDSWLDGPRDSWLDSTNSTQPDQLSRGANFQRLLEQLNDLHSRMDSRWGNWHGDWQQQQHNNPGPQPTVDHPGTLTVASDSDGFVAGATITATVNDPDGFKSGSFQWSVLEGGQWKNIAGATTPKLTLTDNQIGKQIDVTCTYTDNAGHVATIADPFTVEAPVPDPEPPAPDQPGTLAVDSNTGGFASGATVTATVSDPDNVLLAAYEWFVKDANGQWQKIEGVTSSSLTLDDAQAGKEFEVKVTYTDEAGNVATIVTPFSVDALPPPAPSPPPAPPDQPGALDVSSNSSKGFVSGAKVTATVSDPDDVDTATYEWLVKENQEWTKIQGATTLSLTLGDNLAGKEVEVIVNYTDGAGHDAMLTDSFSVAALPPPAPPPPPPNAVGIASISSPNGKNEGKMLTANVTDSDNFNPAAVTYQWQEEVAGSWQSVGTGKTHVIAFDEGGHQLRVLANYTDAVGHTEALVSAPITAVDVDQPGTLTVSSDGNGFDVGDVIQSHLTDPDGVGSGVQYQWSSAPVGSSNWQPISGATLASYTLSAADAGKQIDVTATYIDLQGHNATVADPFTVDMPPPPAPPPPSPPGGSGSGATLLWSQEFNTPLDMKSSSNPDGLWAPVDFWQNINGGGYEDFAGTSFNINPNNPTFAPYNPFSVENGYLQIEVSRTPSALVAPIQQEMAQQGQPGGVPAWTGGILVTNKDVIDFTYGYFEFRERIVNQDEGMFPAMWFYSAKEGADPQGKSNAEIDLYEIFGKPNEWHTSIHGGSSGSEVGSQSADTADWHTYGMLWEPDLLQFYRDGQLLHSVTGPEASYFNDLHLAIRVNFSMDAPWFPASAHSNSTTNSTMQMQIDYIRQYAELPFSTG